MNKVLVIFIFMGMLVGSAQAQESLSIWFESLRLFSADNLDQDISASSSEQPSGDQATCNPRLIPLTAKEKLHYTIKSTYEPSSIAFTLMGAGIKQAYDSVPEWGQGMEGYGKRVASAFGRKIVRRYIEIGMETLLHEDPRYFASEQSGIWRRSMYAASRAFVANKDGGGIRPGYSRFVSAFGSAYISRQWYPENRRNTEEYLKSGAISIGLDAAKNLFYEFWPDAKKLLHR